MAHNYRTWYAFNEEDFVAKMSRFLENVVGYYLTFYASYSDRHFISEGEADDGRRVRIYRYEASSNDIRYDALLEEGYDFATGVFGVPYLGAGGGAEMRNVSVPGRCRVTASKDMVFQLCELSTTSRNSGYIGMVESIYEPEYDPYPFIIKGNIGSSNDWIEGIYYYMLRANDDADVLVDTNFSTAMTNEGYPNPRTGKNSYFQPIIYYNDSIGYYEVRGRMKGIYYGKADRNAVGSFVNIDGDWYSVAKESDENGAILVGPVSDDGTIPTDVVQLGFPLYPSLEVDYTKRGMELDTTISGTTALWRFDTGHLDGYVYGSGSTLPVPTLYPDTAGNYDLIPQASLTSVESRLNEAADFNGSTHYADAAGDTAAADALKDEWTVEIVFRPDALPTGGSKQTIISYGTNGGTESQNILMQVTLTAADGATPDKYNVERGNLEILWEQGAGLTVDNETTNDIIQEDRWNYVAIVKKFNGSDYDVEVWHCSFGDYLVPTRKATFVGNVNATGGTSSGWLVGVSPSPSNYYDGKLDDTRVTARALTQEEIEGSCSRSML